MDKHRLRVGDRVLDSPMGAGEITEFTDVGFPRVDGVAVSWLKRIDGALFDPHGVAPKEKQNG